MLTMYIHELKQLTRSTIIWCISLTVGAAAYLSLYPGLKSQVASLVKILDKYPPAVRAALGFYGDIFTTIIGLYLLTLNFLALAFSIQAMHLGSSIVSKEERGKTAEFLLAKPVTRTQILTSKLLAALTALLFTDAVFVAGTLAMIKAINETIGIEKYFLMTGVLLVLQLFFVSLGFMISVVTPKVRSVLSISLPTVFVFYIVSIFDTIINSKAIRYVTPFKFYDLRYIVKNTAYEPRYLIFEAVLVIVFIASAYVLYTRRDIHTV